MAIEFHCPKCNRQIRTSDQHAGKSGKCPQCQAIVQVPDSNEPSEPEPLLGGGLGDPWEDLSHPATVPQTSNPFGSPGQSAPASWGVPPPQANPYTAPTYQSQTRASLSSDDAMLRWILPIGHSPFAIAAGYLGLFSLVCCPLGPIAFILAILGIIQIQKNPRLSGMGRCVVGIVLGGIGSLGLLFFIFAVIVGDT